MNSINDLKREQSKRAIRRDKEYLRPLLNRVKRESGIDFKRVKSILKYRDISKDLTWIIKSKECILAHFSISALMMYYNRNTSYYIQPTESIIDVWFSNISFDLKQRIMEDDIVIIELSDYDIDYRGPLERVLVEIIKFRESLNKNTWLFIQGEKILKDIPEVINQVQKELFV